MGQMHAGKMNCKKSNVPSGFTGVDQNRCLESRKNAGDSFSTALRFHHPALSLPSEARVLLADRLVGSLDSVKDEKIHRLWVTEALRRRDEVHSGRVKTIPGDEALARVRKAVAR